VSVVQPLSVSRDARGSGAACANLWNEPARSRCGGQCCAACGAGGWLRDLPRLIAELEAEWSVSVGVLPHSSEAFVAEASLADGTPAVLKLLIPQDGAAGRHEITTLRLAGGQGCVGLLRDDAARGRCSWSASGPLSTIWAAHSPNGWRYW